ncbi:MAG: 30S ribosomal protein S8 [Candidatus Methylacidiphilales bacterium]
MQTDPLADFITQIRNANAVSKPDVITPYSRIKSDVAAILKREGFIEDFSLEKVEGKQKLHVKMKHTQVAKPIRGLKKISRPGYRQYVGSQEIPRVLGGLGFAILSTSKGLMTGQDARKENVGGEVLLHVW